jgi:hypothetical protein
VLPARFGGLFVPFSRRLTIHAGRPVQQQKRFGAENPLRDGPFEA